MICSVEGLADLGVPAGEYLAVYAHKEVFSEQWVVRLALIAPQCDQLTEKGTEMDNAKRHKWADVIHAWAEGAVVEWKIEAAEMHWVEMTTPNFSSPMAEYRIKPAGPQTSFTTEQLVELARGPAGYLGMAQEVIKQYILDTEKEKNS